MAGIGERGTMIGEPENDRCYFCGGRLQRRLVTIPFVVGSRVVILKDVPAEICTQCDEPIMKSDVAAGVDRLLKHAFQSGFEVSIVTFNEPALALA